MESQLLKEKLLQFKNITEDLKDVIKNEQPDLIEGLFQKRQVIIDEIETAGYNGDDFRVIADELELVAVCKDLEQTMYQKRDEMKENIEKLKKTKTANRSYVNGSNSIKNFFNKRV